MCCEQAFRPTEFDDNADNDTDKAFFTDRASVFVHATINAAETAARPCTEGAGGMWSNASTGRSIKLPLVLGIPR